MRAGPGRLLAAPLLSRVDVKDEVEGDSVQSPVLDAPIASSMSFTTLPLLCHKPVFARTSFKVCVLLPLVYMRMRSYNACLFKHMTH